MKILGIDPGMNNIGWSILEETSAGQVKYLQSGKISTTTKDSLTSRLAFIFKEISKIISSHSPDAVSIEEIFVNINPRSSMTLSFARGAILCCIGYHNLPALEFAPNTIKKTITGNGKADKEQVMKMLKFIIPNVSFSSPDEADAIAIGYTGIILKIKSNI